MRTRIASALLLSAASAFAQGKTAADSATTQSAVSTLVSGTGTLTRLRLQLWALGLSDKRSTLPSVEQFTSGHRVIDSGTTISAPVGVTDGSLDVFGKINGTVVVIDGNLRIHPGAQITGDAMAVRGRVINQGGSVGGESRSLTGLSIGGRDERTGPPHDTMWAGKLTLGWFAVLALIGVGVMIFAESNLDGVVLTLERGIGRSFVAGLLGQFAALPALVLLCVALALTILGILLIPFAIVAYIIAMAGLVTLGFLAIARLSGIPAVRSYDLTARGVNLRGLFIGLIGYLGLWLIAAAFRWQPVAGGALRVVALLVTWVAATAGLGATLLSRAGTRRAPGRSAAAQAAHYSWQTPPPG